MAQLGSNTGRSRVVWFHPGAQSTCYRGALSLLSYVIAFSYHFWLSQAKLHLSSFYFSLSAISFEEIDTERGGD